MARYDHLPIWKTAMDLAVLSRQSEQLCCRSRRGYSLRVLERAVRGFPRYHKYALGADLRRQAQRICALIVRANEARAERERIVGGALAPIFPDSIAAKAAPSAPVKARKQHGASPCRSKPRLRSRR